MITDLDLDICKIYGMRHFLFIQSGWQNCLVSILVLSIWYSLLNHTGKMDYIYSCVNWVLNSNKANYFPFLCCVGNVWNDKTFSRNRKQCSVLCCLSSEVTWLVSGWGSSSILPTCKAGLYHENNEWSANNAENMKKWMMWDILLTTSTKVLKLQKLERNEERIFI